MSAFLTGVRSRETKRGFVTGIPRTSKKAENNITIPRYRKNSSIMAKKLGASAVYWMLTTTRLKTQKQLPFYTQVLDELLEIVRK